MRLCPKPQCAHLSNGRMKIEESIGQVLVDTVAVSLPFLPESRLSSLKVLGTGLRSTINISSHELSQQEGTFPGKSSIIVSVRLETPPHATS